MMALHSYIFHFQRNAMTLQFEVVRQFKAAKSISGVEREFQPRESFICDVGQRGTTVAIEFEMSFFVIERSILDTCCRRRFEGEAGGAC
jgi:hypothetical protein